jgi:hypothetical protein
LWQLRHLVRQVVHGDDLVAGGNGGCIDLRRLLDLLESMSALCGVEYDAGAELRVRHRREREDNCKN